MASGVSERQVHLYAGSAVYSSLNAYLDRKEIRNAAWSNTRTITLASPASFQLFTSAATGAGFPNATVLRSSTASLADVTYQANGEVVAANAAGFTAGTGVFAATTAVDSNGIVANLVEIRDVLTHNPIEVTVTGAQRRVYGLLQTPTASTDTVIYDNTGGAENVQLSFAYFDASNVLTAATVPAGTYEFEIRTIYSLRNQGVVTVVPAPGEVEAMDIVSTLEMRQMEVTTQIAAETVTPIIGAVTDMTQRTASASFPATVTNLGTNLLNNGNYGLFRNGVRLPFQATAGAPVSGDFSANTWAEAIGQTTSTTSVAFATTLDVGEVVAVSVPH